MRTGLLVLCGVLVVTSSTLGAASSRLATLSARIAAAIGAQAPEWSVSDSTLSGNRFEQAWRHGFERLGIRCEEHPSVNAASEALAGVVLEAAGGRAVEGIGDAARIWPDWSASGDTTIYLRRATFVCDTVAPSQGLARRFAAVIVQEIDALEGKHPPAKAAPLIERRVAIVLVGIDHSSIEVPVGARVTFVNQDPHFAHDLTSSCAEIDAVGRLEPGQSGHTAVFTSARTCAYHDRLQPTNPLRRGTIVVR